MRKPISPTVRYVLHPGYVTSINDGDVHYIGIAKLASLYGLKYPAPNVIVEDGRLADQYLPSDIHLYPRHGGDYRLPTK